jgi:hypothetical protein
MKENDHIQGPLEESGYIVSMRRQPGWPNRKTIKVYMMGDGPLLQRAVELGIIPYGTPKIVYLSRRDFNAAYGKYKLLDKQ